MSEKPSDAELYAAYIEPDYARWTVAMMGLRDIRKRVAKVRRSRSTPERWRNLPMEDREIAIAILDAARGMSFARELREPTEKLLVQIADRQWDLLEAQTMQSEYLSKINSVMQLLGFLLILSLIGIGAQLLFGS